MPAANFRTTIIPREVKVTYEGKTKSGTSYRLFQVIATKLDGSPIDFNLRSFEEFAVGVPAQVDAELFTSQNYPDSYTLKRVGPNPLEVLRQRVERIEKQLGLSGSTEAPSPSTAGPPPVPSTAPTERPPDHPF